MAKLSAHGSIIGTVEFTTSAKRYMSDGKVLKNDGFGWKIRGTVKAGVTPQEAYQHAVEVQRAYLEVRPALSAYRAALHDLAGLCKRWKLNAAVSLMPDDPDGVWSEACDGYGDNISADVDEVSRLCTLYGAAILEQKSLKGETVEA